MGGGAGGGSGLISVFVGEQWYEADVLTGTATSFKSTVNVRGDNTETFRE